MNKQRELRSAFNHQVVSNNVRIEQRLSQNLENHAESILMVGLAFFAKLYFPFYALENEFSVNGPSIKFSYTVLANKGADS